VPLEQPQAQYRQLAALLREAIEAGEFPPGSALPPEPELGARYGVSRDTVNNAVRILRNWGLVQVQRGRGTIVRSLPVIRRNAVARYMQEARERAGAHGAFDTEIRALGLEPRSDTTVDLVVPPAEVARQLGLDEGKPNTIRRLRRMYANDIPVQLAPSYIPAEIAEGTQIAEVDSGPGGIISRFAELGYAQARITEAIRSRPASDEEREFLRLEADQPVMEIWHVGWTAKGRPVEVCVHAVPAGLWQLEYEWPVS
jgi:DNA-binding GntR family transcriptional regulator